MEPSDRQAGREKLLFDTPFPKKSIALASGIEMLDGRIKRRTDPRLSSNKKIYTAPRVLPVQK